MRRARRAWHAAWRTRSRASASACICISISSILQLNQQLKPLTQGSVSGSSEEEDDEAPLDLSRSKAAAAPAADMTKPGKPGKPKSEPGKPKAEPATDAFLHLLVCQLAPVRSTALHSVLQHTRKGMKTISPNDAYANALSVVHEWNKGTRGTLLSAKADKPEFVLIEVRVNISCIPSTIQPCTYLWRGCWVPACIPGVYLGTAQVLHPLGFISTCMSVVCNAWCSSRYPHFCGSSSSACLPPGHSRVQKEVIEAAMAVIDAYDAAAKEAGTSASPPQTACIEEALYTRLRAAVRSVWGDGFGWADMGQVGAMRGRARARDMHRWSGWGWQLEWLDGPNTSLRDLDGWDVPWGELRMRTVPAS